MPDGQEFAFWDDTTRYGRVYHVAARHPKAADDGPGSEERPWATIGRAARTLQPGEKVVVHAGVYRECVRPARGGEGPDRMIAYEAARGEEVIVRGSEVWKPAFEPSRGWSLGPLPAGAKVWSAALPPEWFVGYNPFMTANASSEFMTFTRDWTDAEAQQMLLRRGMVFANGRPLRQVYRSEDLGKTEGAFWVEDPGLRLHLRLWGDADPAGADLEVTTREQVFAPAARGLGYLRVSRFAFEHAADGIPVPQRAMVSAARGHHWIVEDCCLRWANATGLDVGNESWHCPGGTDTGPAHGRHILRCNRVSDCGICGLAAVGNNVGTLVEDNVVERIGGMNLERIWETGGLKFHLCDTVLIRRNVFRHLRGAPGVWLDYLNRNCRITRNVFVDIEGIHGGVYLEVSQHPNVIDHNVIWDIRGPNAMQGHAVDVDSGEYSVVAHNLIGRVRDGFAVAVHLGQAGRLVDGRVGLGRRHTVANNVILECPRRILFARAEENRCDGNLYDAAGKTPAFLVQFPAPEARLNLEAWREFYGFDRRGREVGLRAEVDADGTTLKLALDTEVPAVPAVAALHEGDGPRAPGPVPLRAHPLKRLVSHVISGSCTPRPPRGQTVATSRRRTPTPPG
jgi:hypothetical protein